MDNLKQEVLNDLENYETEEDKINYLKDVLNHGCVSGIVSKLIYYTDTCSFYDRNEDEIESLIYDNADNQGLTYLGFISSLNGANSVDSMQRLKNLLSWFAYEETARNVLIEDFNQDY